MQYRRRLTDYLSLLAVPENSGSKHTAMCSGKSDTDFEVGVGTTLYLPPLNTAV